MSSQEAESEGPVTVHPTEGFMVSTNTFLKKVVVAAFLIILFLPARMPAQGSTLSAGTEVVAITPPPGLGQAGYAARGDKKAVGTLDPLYARILVLKGTNTKVALVALDLIGNFEEHLNEEICREARNSCGIEHVLFAPSHTHSGPSFGGRASTGITGEWERETIRKVKGAIKAADGKLKEAYLGTGFGEAYIGYNRRSNWSGSLVQKNEDAPALVSTFPYDPTVGVVRLDDAEGHPLAVLVNYGCHPVVFSADNLKYSADYPGAMAEWVTGHLPGAPLCFFIQGGLGNVNPITNPVSIDRGAVKVKNELGYTLGKEVVRICREIKTEPVNRAEMTVEITPMKFTCRWDPELMRHTMLVNYGDDFLQYVEHMIKPELEAPLTVFMLKDRFGICGFPGEFYCEFQEDLRRRFTEFPLFFAGFMNGDIGYFPTIKAAAEGGYGANSVMTAVEVGAGERMVDEAVVRLYHLAGKLKRTAE